MFLLENVRGLVTARDAKGEPGGVISTLHRKLQNLGYSCRATLLNAVDFGAYQRRVRCFMVGTQKGTAPSFPDPSHQKNPDMFHERWKSLRMFLREHGDTDERNFVFPTENLRVQLEALPDGTGIKSACVTFLL